MDAVAAVDGGVRGDVLAAVHHGGARVLLAVSRTAQRHVLHEVVLADGEGLHLLAVDQVLVGYA